MSNMSDETTRVQWHSPAVARPRGRVVWFTGLSGSGKSTIANRVDAWLHNAGIPSFVLDGDNLRHGLNASPERLAGVHGDDFARRFGLSFAAEDREENIRRTGWVAELMCEAGLIVLTAFVSPYRRDRDLVRSIVGGRGSPADFVEVFVNTPLDICEQRDPKGLYRLARAGQLKGLTGIDAPYEPPLNPELELAGGNESVDGLADRVLKCLGMPAGQRGGAG
jgi:adenylylsulfate kinase